MPYELPEKFTKPYDSSATEQDTYKKWEESGFFNPDNHPNHNGKTWSTVMPPPNANGRLHAGHGLDMTIKDILTRFKRMQGYKALFLPGADHAGFETQIVYERKLEKEKRSRFQMEPADLYKEIYDFTLENKQVMEDDIRRLGTSCDWSRAKFTLDDDIVARVHQTFVKMYNDGLVYRGKRSCNWCTKHQTSLSNVETEALEQKTKFYYFQYGPFVIGTARPETKFADKYIVVHPEDARYAKYDHMQEFEVEWINGPITATLIKDDVADMEKGSGAMTITPWHSEVDFNLAQKYDLPMEQIIDKYGKLLPIAGSEFEGLKIAVARDLIVAKLQSKGLVVEIDENYEHALKVCYKCKRALEPQVMDQWFIKMDKLAAMALEAVDSEDLNFLTPQFEKTFRHWMENPIDWNISRQIVWGIQIPAWFKNKGQDNEEIFVGPDAPGDEWIQDTDTFDTWFSSGQWPLVALGFPEGQDFETFYPTDVMQTGRDLIFKWIPRMVMFGMYLTGKSPFKMVYLHGMINDKNNQKMSKSKGNTMSPIDLGDQFGTDALRMSLIVGNTPGNDMALSEDKVRAYKKFANKIWNASRFVLENVSDFDFKKPEHVLEKHQAYLDELNEAITETTREIEEYKLYLAAERMYHFFWHTFADVVIEDCKNDINGSNVAAKVSAQHTLITILTTSLKMLHPFMPFITEEIWSLLPQDTKQNPDKLLIIESWPVSH